MHRPNAADAMVQIGEIRRRLGDYEGAEAAFQRAEELSGHMWAGIALLRLAQGRRQVATKIITTALDETSWHQLARGKLLPVYVHVLVDVGELDRARAGADELAQIAQDYESPVLLAAAETARGRVELAEGNPAAACATLHGALARWTELNVPYEIATTRLLMGHACRDTGDVEGANSSYDTAEAIFERLGVATDARASRELRSRGSLPGGLSEREAEVLRLVAKGRTNRQIATGLQLSEKTIARHLSNIFAKIDVASRAAATAFAFECGLVGGS
jgi:DNA-binding CsgD family transcriptional regulator